MALLKVNENERCFQNITPTIRLKVAYLYLNQSSYFKGASFKSFSYQKSFESSPSGMIGVKALRDPLQFRTQRSMHISAIWEIKTYEQLHPRTYQRYHSSTSTGYNCVMMKYERVRQSLQDTGQDRSDGLILMTIWIIKS